MSFEKERDDAALNFVIEKGFSATNIDADWYNFSFKAGADWSKARCDAEIAELKRQNEIMREALEWINNPTNSEGYGPWNYKARAALAAVGSQKLMDIEIKADQTMPDGSFALELDGKRRYFKVSEEKDENA